MNHTPDAGDHPAVIDYVIRTGQAIFNPADLPRDFVAWRSALRRVARARGTRLSVLRAAKGRVFVLDPDFQPSAIELGAVASAIERAMAGEPSVPWDVAVELERRRQIRVLREK